MPSSSSINRWLHKPRVLPFICSLPVPNASNCRHTHVTPTNIDTFFALLFMRSESIEFTGSMLIERERRNWVGKVAGAKLIDLRCNVICL